MGEEIDRLTSELERAHAQEARSRLSAQEWQTRAEEAERELSRIQGSLAEVNNTWRTMGQALATVRKENQDLNPVGQGEPEAHSTSGIEQDIVMTGAGVTPVSDPSSMRRSRGGSQDSENPLPHDPNALSRLRSDLQHGSTSGRSLPSSRPGLKRKFEPAVRDAEGPSFRRPPPPVPTHPRVSPPDQPSFARRSGPSDRNVALSHVAGGVTEIANRPRNHANMEGHSFPVGEMSRLVEGYSPQINELRLQIPRILIPSIAPSFRERPDSVPLIYQTSWANLGGDMKSMNRWPWEDQSDEDEQETGDHPEE